MLSTPHKRFAWARLDRTPDFTFFRILLMRRRPPAPPPSPRRRAVAAADRPATGTWKPSAWTPWLWVK
jgi:hypothetical protein